MVRALGLLTLSLSSCTQRQDASTHPTDYDYSCDVPLSGWRSQDTLFYPITVCDAPERRHPLLLGTTYDVWCSVRMAASYPYDGIPMTLIVQQLKEVEHHADSLTTYTTLEVSRNLLRQDIHTEVRTATGQPIGDTWGSLISCEAPVEDLSLRFDSAGSYRLLILPKTPSGLSLSGLSAIGLTLHRQ